MSEPLELVRVRAALRAIDEVVADRVEPSPVGAALLVDDLPLVWRRLNVLRVESETTDPSLVASEAERLLGGLLHRAVVVRASSCPELAAALVDAGWILERQVVMVNRHRRLPRATHADEVRVEDLREHSATFRAGRPYASEALVAELSALDGLYSERGGARHFAVRDAGQWVASCQLLSADRVGEVHAVGTLEGHRGRGHARAVIDRALLASAEAGHELTFLQAVESDWPRHLYRRLGFEHVGVFSELYRFDSAHPARALYGS